MPQIYYLVSLLLALATQRTETWCPHLVPVTFLSNISFPHPLLCFSCRFSCSSSASFLIFFNHSLSFFLNPSSPFTSPLAFFYQVLTTFLPQCLFRETIFSSDAKLLSNKSTCSKSISTTIYYASFSSLSPIHLGSFLPLNSLFFTLSDKENTFCSFRRLEQGHIFFE